jgi:hypothetical protein
MKNNIIFLRIAGSISLLFMLFHLAFYRLFNWEHSLECLSQSDRSILITYHYISILILGFMGIVPLLQTKTLLNSPLKYSVLTMFGLFYLIRIVTEFTLFGLNKISSPIILIMCILPMILYILPLLSAHQTKNK